MTFKSKPLSALDKSRDLELYRPRVVQTNVKDVLGFEFEMRRGTEKTGISASGTIIERNDGVTSWVFRIENVADLNAYERQRERIAPDLTLTQFVLLLADGMTSVYASGVGVLDDSEFSVVMARSLAIDLGIEFPQDPQDYQGEFAVIAKRFVFSEKPPYPKDEA